MTINGKEFKIQKISGYSKEYQKLKGHIKDVVKEEQNVGNIPKSKIEMPPIEQPKEDISINNQSLSIWDILKEKIAQVKPVIEQFRQSIGGVGSNSKELELVKYKISEIEEKLEKAKNGEIHLKTKDILEAEAQLERLNNKKEKLEKGDSGKVFSAIFSNFGKVIPKMNEMSGITIKIKNQIRQWSSGLKSGLGQVLKYAGALFSLRSIYFALSSSANAWLSSQNSQAKQLSANIDYLKYSVRKRISTGYSICDKLCISIIKSNSSCRLCFI